jgi:uncharacterized membrane protein
MRIELLNRNKILGHILPSFFFLVLFAVGSFSSRLMNVKLIAGSIALLILGNIFLQNKIISRILGYIFLLGSIYMVLGIFLDRETTWNYWNWAGEFLALFGIIMSVLLISGYKKKEQLREIE